MKWLYGLLLAGTVALVQAEMQPEPGILDSRIRTAPYSSEQVYRLIGFVGYQTDLEFETGETFVGLGAGDIEGLSFVAADNHLFLKPRAAKIGTNLTILTSRRTYQFDYSAASLRPDATEEVTYALRFTYPAVAKEGGDPNRALEAGFPRSKNIDYWFCGDPSLQPTAASDDGILAGFRRKDHQRDVVPEIDVHEEGAFAIGEVVLRREEPALQ